MSWCTRFFPLHEFVMPGVSPRIYVPVSHSCSGYSGRPGHPSNCIRLQHAVRWSRSSIDHGDTFKDSTVAVFGHLLHRLGTQSVLQGVKRFCVVTSRYSDGPQLWLTTAS